jgi:hypothetical protein
MNDLFGIQARGGCGCAGPYGHDLLDVGDELSLRIRSAILKVSKTRCPRFTCHSIISNTSSILVK